MTQRSRTLHDFQGQSNIVDGTPDLLIADLVGIHAAATFQTHRSIWRLVQERATYGLPPTERRRLDALASIVRELGHEPRVPPQASITTPQAAAALFSQLALLPSEEFWVAFLNVRNLPVAVLPMALGGLHSVAFSPGSIFREALLRNTPTVVLAHNHPSGDPSPSDSDRIAFRQLESAAQLLDIKLLDSLTFGAQGRVFSLLMNGEFIARAVG